MLKATYHCHIYTPPPGHCVCLSAWNNSTRKWTNFLEILYWKLLINDVDQIQIWLKSDKNKRYFTRRPVFTSTACHLSDKVQETGQRQGGQRNIWPSNHNTAPQICRVVRVKPRTHLIVMLHLEFLTCSCIDLP